jgi:hypothetical protein
MKKLILRDQAFICGLCKSVLAALVPLRKD